MNELGDICLLRYSRAALSTVYSGEGKTSDLLLGFIAVSCYVLVKAQLKSHV